VFPSGLSASYDAIGRISQTSYLAADSSGAITPNGTRSFAYDALGNLTQQTDASPGNPGSVSLFYQAPDLERVCSLAYGSNAQATAPCNVAYDGAGNIIRQPTRTGTRTLTYFPGGAVSTIQDGTSNATFTYDAFGALQQLAVGGPAENRADKYFGAFIKQRIEGAQSVLTRRIPLPGLTATRHGATGSWTLPFDDGRGTRTVTDQGGSFFRQDIDYTPFGEVRNQTGAAPGSANYTTEQWNGGDLLAAFGLVNLGARLYDPVTARFLSRDPIIGKNPYAFAANDPINRADPTGLIPDGGTITKGRGQDLPPQAEDQGTSSSDWGNNRDYNPGSLDGSGVASLDSSNASIGPGVAAPGSLLYKFQSAFKVVPDGVPIQLTIGGKDFNFSSDPAWRVLQLDALIHNYPLPTSWWEDRKNFYKNYWRWDPEGMKQDLQQINNDLSFKNGFRAFGDRAFDLPLFGGLDPLPSFITENTRLLNDAIAHLRNIDPFERAVELEQYLKHDFPEVVAGQRQIWAQVRGVENLWFGTPTPDGVVHVIGVDPLGTVVFGRVRASLLNSHGFSAPGLRLRVGGRILAPRR
jgi:RHS repeat-associated protein